MAKTTWGRKETIIWPPHSPIYTYGAIFLALILTTLFLYCRLSFRRYASATVLYCRSMCDRPSAGAIGANTPRQVPDALCGRA